MKSVKFRTPPRGGLTGIAYGAILDSYLIKGKTMTVGLVRVWLLICNMTLFLELSQ